MIEFIALLILSVFSWWIFDRSEKAFNKLKI